MSILFIVVVVIWQVHVVAVAVVPWLTEILLDFSLFLPHPVLGVLFDGALYLFSRGNQFICLQFNAFRCGASGTAATASTTPMATAVFASGM